MSRYFSFNVGKKTYGFPLDSIEEIFTPTAITPIPLSSPSVVGLCNHRGHTVTVINSLGAKAQENYICFAYEQQYYAFPVDVVGAVMLEGGGDTAELVTPEDILQTSAR